MKRYRFRNTHHYMQCVVSCGRFSMKYLLAVFLLFLTSGLMAQEQGTAPGIQPVRIHKIHIEGNSITRRSVILRELSIHEGATMPADSIDALIAQNKLRLFNLQLFNEVEQRTERNGNDIDWYIRIKERWYIIPSAIVQFADRNFNTWWVAQNHDLHRISAGLTLTDKNFRGNMEILTATVQAGYTQKLGINYIRPYVNKGQTNGIGISAAVARSTQTYYTTNLNKLAFTGGYTGPAILRQAEVGVSYLYRPAYASRHTFQLSYKDYSVRDTVVKLKPDYYADNSRRARFMELYYRYEYNGVDNWNYSLKGYKLVANAVARQGIEGLNFQSYAMVEAGMFRNPLPKWYYSLIFRGRVMLPANQPYFFRSGLGTQTDYVRGYEYYVIDGSHYGLLRLDLKRQIFNNTYTTRVKYFTAIPVRIYPKVFFDVGYIDSPVPGNSFLSNQLLYSVGAGLDIVTFYDIKFRIEFAYNRMRQNGLYLHFNSE